MGKQHKKPEHIIVSNKKAFHDYFIETRFEAGLTLLGWEVKSLRDNRAQLKESYVILKDEEAWLIGAHFSPLPNTSRFGTPDPTRSRKLLLHAKELKKLRAGVTRDGYTLIALNLHWRRNLVKCEIALAKGKKLHDKRAASKARDWDRDKARLLNRIK